MDKRFIRRSSATAAFALAALTLTVSLPASAQSDSQSSSNASSAASSSNQSSGSTSSSSSSSGISSDTAPSGSVLWTAPDYQVKSVGRKPAASSLPPDIAPNQGSAAAAAAAGGDQSQFVDANAASSSGTSGRRKRRKADPSQDPSAYDESAAKAFAQAVSTEPQYVWLSPDRPSAANQSKFQQNRVLASTEQLNRLDSYIKDLSQSIQGSVSVPGSAQLVETANRKYSYLFSFVIKNNGQISNVTNEKQVGALTSSPLADDDENSQVEKAINRALAKVSPVKVPPAGFAPWYMLLKYDVNSGKVFVACLNAK